MDSTYHAEGDRIVGQIFDTSYIQLDPLTAASAAAAASPATFAFRCV